MPAGQINDLLDIVAAMNVAAGGETPFTTHKDLYSTINATILGNAPWDHSNLNYQGETDENSPLWQTKDFTVWLHNPLTVLHNLLSTATSKRDSITHHFRSVMTTTTIGTRILCPGIGVGNKLYIGLTKSVYFTDLHLLTG